MQISQVLVAYAKLNSRENSCKTVKSGNLLNFNLAKIFESQETILAKISHVILDKVFKNWPSETF